MGALRKIGIVFLTYIILGVVFTFLLLNGFVDISENNMLIDILYAIFYPVIIATNFIYVTLPFVP